MMKRLIITSLIFQLLVSCTSFSPRETCPDFKGSEWQRVDIPPEQQRYLDGLSDFGATAPFESQWFQNGERIGQCDFNTKNPNPPCGSVTSTYIKNKGGWEIVTDKIHVCSSGIG